MLPCLFMSDVDVNQQGPVNFDSFPFIAPISPRSQSLSGSYHNSATPYNEHQDWKTFFQSFKEGNSTTTARPQVTSSETSRTKEKKKKLFLKGFDVSNQLDSETESKQVLNTSSYKQITSQTNDPTTEQKQADDSSSLNTGFKGHKGCPVADSSDPCSGLTDFIRRKNKKQFLCVRCGSTHSNCVKAKNQASPIAKQLRHFRSSRILSASSATSKKVIIICPNCGKRSHSSAIRDQDVNFYRSLTWPLPLERIVEDEAESHCFAHEGCFSDTRISHEMSFESSDEKQLSNDDVTFTRQQNQLFHSNGFQNGVTKKVLLASACPAALSYVKEMRQWTLKKFGDNKLVHFVVMATTNNMRSHPELMRSADSRVIVGQTSHNDLDNEIKVIVETAKANRVQAVWVGKCSDEKYNALRKSLDEAGISLHAPALLSHATFDATPVSENKSDAISQLPSSLRLNGVQCGNDASLDDSKSYPATFSAVALLSAATHIADRAHRSRASLYLEALQKGEILPTYHLSPTDHIELTYHGNSYVMQATKLSTTRCFVTDGTWALEIHLNRLTDSGLLLTLDGATHTTYLKEVAKSYKITVDEKVYVFDKSQSAKSTSPPPCSDRLSRSCRQPELFGHRLCEEMEKLNCAATTKTRPRIDKVNEESNKVMQSAHDLLTLVMRGWYYPESAFAIKTSKAVNDLITSLNDPALPLLQMQDAISSTSGCLPPPVEKFIRQEMSRYASNITSMMSIFPGSRIRKIVSSFAKSLPEKCDQESFLTTAKPILQVVDRFSNGIRGFLKSVLLELLRDYYGVEVKFQQSSFDESVSCLMENHDSDMVLQLIRSHAGVAQKNFVALLLIKNLASRENNLTDDVIRLLGDISNLSNEDNAKVALFARQVLRKAKKLSYELRYNQMDSLFLSMTGSCDDAIFKSINDVDIFEILPQFFLHSKPEVRMVAMEIYIRRAFSASCLHSLQHHHVSDHSSAVVFNYNLPSDNKLLSRCDGNEQTTESLNAAGNGASMNVEVMASFAKLDQIERYLREILQLFDSNSFQENSRHIFKTGTCERSSNHTLSVAMVTTDDVQDDESLCEQYKKFIKSHETQLRNSNLQRVTFLVHQRNAKTKHFTFKLNKDEITEEQMLRHIDPHLACALGINDLRNLVVLPSQQDLHLYFAASKQEESIVHVLGAIRDDSAENKEMSVAVFHNDVELLILEALDELEELNFDMDQHPKRIFFNIIKNMKPGRENVEEGLREVILRHGKRLYKRKVKTIEVSYGKRSNNTDDICHVLKVNLCSET